MSEPDTPRGSGAAGDTARLVGRRHELRLLRQAVTLRRPVLLLGPPGESKTTMLRALAGPAAQGRDPVHWVTGDEQLSAHVLVGTTPGAELLGPAVRAVFDELSVPVQAPGPVKSKP